MIILGKDLSILSLMSRRPPAKASGGTGKGDRQLSIINGSGQVGQQAHRIMHIGQIHAS
jgi:hypothetical protein